MKSFLLIKYMHAWSKSSAAVRSARVSELIIYQDMYETSTLTFIDEIGFVGILKIAFFLFHEFYSG